MTRWSLMIKDLTEVSSWTLRGEAQGEEAKADGARTYCSRYHLHGESRILTILRRK